MLFQLQPVLGLEPHLPTWHRRCPGKLWGPGCRLQLLFSWSQGQETLISHTCWLETPWAPPVVVEKPTSCPKPGCATKPGAICPFLQWTEELPAFSGVFPRGCAPGAVLRAFAPCRGSLTRVSWGSSSSVCQSQAAWWEGGSKAGREGGGGLRVLQPQTERAGFFPFYFLFSFFLI